MSSGLHRQGYIKQQPEVKESDARVTFKANPTQHAFIIARNDADLFSCRMGEGKSAALCWAVFHHTRHNPGARWAVIRDTWENCRDTTQKEFFDWFKPGLFGRYHAASKTFTWMIDGVEGEVSFMGMDDPKDAAKLQSRALAGFAMDEPAPAAESGGIAEEIFDVAMTRLRQPRMNWYAAKLAENNPDESHWTYRRFVDPGSPGMKLWQTAQPENLDNLPRGYYEKMRERYTHRPDLWRRFGEGRFGFQQIGQSVTPEWNDELHLSDGLEPICDVPLRLGWDFGLTPTCLITQVSPLGCWHVLEAIVGEEIGAYELIRDVVGPRLSDAYKGFDWEHTGDPMGSQREQSSSEQSAVKVIQRSLGGAWRPGPVPIRERIEPLRGVLARVREGRGILQVDRYRAKAVWYALRGGWHYHVPRSGVTTTVPRKDLHSHPGDAMGYLAARLFPLGRLKVREEVARPVRSARYWRSGGLGIETPYHEAIPHGHRLGDPIH